MSLLKRIRKAKDEYWFNNGIEPEFIIIRPELRADLIMEVHLLKNFEDTLMYEIEQVEGMQVAISEDPFLLDFKFGIYSCSV